MTTPEDTGAAVPPYEGRKSEADSEQSSEKDGARTGGATGPVNDDRMKADEPENTERGSVASPADEQPAESTPDGESPERSVGPSHEPGTGRGEDRSQ